LFVVPYTDDNLVRCPADNRQTKPIDWMRYGNTIEYVAQDIKAKEQTMHLKVGLCHSR
jgi:hypothetical protein